MLLIHASYAYMESYAYESYVNGTVLTLISIGILIGPLQVIFHANESECGSGSKVKKESVSSS